MAAPTPPAHSSLFLWQLQAIHLLVPRKLMPFTARTAANISSCLVISAAKTCPLSSCTSIYKPVSNSFTSSSTSFEPCLQATSFELCWQVIWEPLTYMLLQAISFNRPQSAPLHYTAFRLAGSVIRGRLLRQRPLIPSHKAKPRSSAQLSKMLHQPAFIPFHSLRSFRSSFTQSLSQPHSST